MRNRLTVFSLALAFILAVASILYAQVFAVPKSDLMVEGRLLLPGGGAADFQVRDGAMLSVRDEEMGFWYGFVPVIKGAINGRPYFLYYVISPQEGTEPAVRQVGEPVYFEAGSECKFPALDRSLDLQVRSVKEGVFRRIRVQKTDGLEARELQRMYGPSGGGLCALSCGSSIFSANAVALDCGSCETDGARFSSLRY